MFNLFQPLLFSFGVLKLMFLLLPVTTPCYFDTTTITLSLLFKFDSLISIFRTKIICSHNSLVYAVEGKYLTVVETELYL